MKTKIAILICFLASGMGLNASQLQENYVTEYRDVAISEMKQYGIPASITLAQGLLESGSGTSYLAVKANNHFGIKCHNDWHGKKVYRDDDAKNECFRAYKHAGESFRDHSLFLSNRSRYASLFDEDPTDYKAWAKGLKKAGYATNKRYADLLIDLIERYDLHQYDDPSYRPVKKVVVPPDASEESFNVYVSDNRVKYVIAKEGEDIYDIAFKTQRWPGELEKYNEIAAGTTINAGQRIYLQPKRNKTAKETTSYKVREGDSIYSISQKFAIKTRHLRRKNGLKAGEEPQVGQSLKLR